MRKTVLIELDKARNMRLGTNQFAMIQDLGLDLNNHQQVLGFRELRTILFVALSWEDKKLTLEQVGDMMDDVICDENRGMAYLEEKIEACINNFAPNFVGKI